MFSALQILIFSRPFISSLAYPYFDFAYSLLLILLSAYLIFSKADLFTPLRLIRTPLFLFCFAVVCSVIFGVNFAVSFNEIYKYVEGILLLLIVASFSADKKIQIIRIIILSGFIISLLAIYQYFFGFRHILAYLAAQKNPDQFTLDYISRKRVFFPFITPNALGGYLAMIIPLTLALKNKLWLILPLVFALLLTKSIGAVLGCLLGLIIYFLLKGDNDNKSAAAIAVLFSLICVTIIARLLMTKNNMQPLFSATSRIGYWKDSLSIIVSRPLFGVGLGNFNLAQVRYAHNSYLQIWAETGIVGIVAFGWLAATVFKEAITRIRKNTGNIQLASLVAAGSIFLIHNLIDFTFFLPEIAVIWWVILGLMMPDKPGDISE